MTVPPGALQGTRSATAARVLRSRWYRLIDVLWLAVEEAVVLSCGERLFSGLTSQRPTSAAAAVLSGALWMVLAARLRAPLYRAADPDVVSRRDRAGAESLLSPSSPTYRLAIRLALYSLLLRVAVVTAAAASLGALATHAGLVPLRTVAFLLWTSATLTPLLDAGRALLEHHAAMHVLGLAARLAARAATARRDPTGPEPTTAGPSSAAASARAVALLQQFHRDTFAGRALLIGLGLLGLAVAGALTILSFVGPALPGVSRLEPLLFCAPAIGLLTLSLAVVAIDRWLRHLNRAAAPQTTPGAGPTDRSGSRPDMAWLPGGLSHGTALCGLGFTILGSFVARHSLDVPAVTVAVCAAICAACVIAAAISQAVILRTLDPPPLPMFSPPARSDAATPPQTSDRSAHQAIRSAYLNATAALLAVIGPPVGAILCLLLQIPSAPARWQRPVGAAAALLGTTLLLMALRVRKGLRPLLEATQQAHALLQEADPPPLSATPRRRKTRLARTLRTMQQALQTRLMGAAQAQSRLESEVAARTHDLRRRNEEIEAHIRLLSAAQAALSEAEQLAAIGQLIAGIAHEVNNPINAALNAALPLREGLTDLRKRLFDPAAPPPSTIDPELRAMLRVVDRGSQRTFEIVRSLWRYAESDSDPQAMTAVDIHACLDEAWDLLQHPLKPRLQLIRTYGADAPVLAHGGELQQVFLNLLSNAVHATAEQLASAPENPPPAIELRTEQQGGWLHAAVIDHGPGIPASLHARIFEPFFSTKDVAQGSGLGLAIAHGIVTRHGGRIVLESTPGQGARFTVLLPLRPRS